MSSTAGFALWTFATAGHFALTAIWIRRLWPGQPPDVTVFGWTLAAIAGLAATVHLTATAGGLTIGRGAAALALGHAIAWSSLRRQAPAARQTGPSASRVERVLEAAAMAVLVAIAVAWCDGATRSLAVSGSDAAHYHVPVAINLALGTDFFDLGPTSHLYPMTSSALAAWFILPLRDTLLVDLTMLLPFMLLAASSAWLFRLVTGLSGLAWTTWALLALFSTPLFRASSLMSADLLFAASFVALTAQIVTLLTTSCRPADFILAGLATGLVVGSKTTGLPAAGIVWGLAALLWPLVRRNLPAGLPPSSVGSRLATIAGAIALAIATGGIWLVRNWVLWGSPLGTMGVSFLGVEVFDGAPHEATTYLSVLGDMRADPTYDVIARTVHFTSAWLAPWFLPALLPLVWYGVELVRGGRIEVARRRRDARRVAAAMIVGSGVPIVWLLAGAPWTSLEWTRGYSLRYILPWLAALPLLAFAGCFPARAPWVQRDPARAIAGATVAIAGVTALLVSQIDSAEWPRLTPGAAFVAAAASIVMLGGTRLRPHAAPALAALLIVTLGTLWTVQASSRNDTLLGAEQARTDGPATAAQAVYAAALEHERASGQPCESRRFFILTRFDEPMALQSPVLRNRVFYAARDVRVTARAGPLARCDFIVTSRPVLETDKGRAFIATLNPGGRTTEVAQAGAFVLMAPR